MDALSRVEPVARPLLREVDEALLTLGAPPDHPVWALLRRTAATPAQVVEFFVDAEPEQLRSTAGQLRDQAGAYAATALAAGVSWAGSAGQAYTARAHALDAYLRGDMARGLEATASYVEELALWYERSRDRIARALGEILGSAQVVALRTHRVGHPVAVRAAADIGAHVLDAAVVALDDGCGLPGGWSSRLAELTFRAPTDAGARRYDAAIHLHH